MVIEMLGIQLAGAAPGLALLLYFYLKDRYEPEPLIMVFRTFIFGALLVLPIAFIEYVLKVENMVMNELSVAFSSGLIEEFFKWAILYLAAYRHREFDEPFDGIVYGSSLSLGFATAENIMYLMINGMEYALIRALLPVSSHALFGVMMGFYMSKAKFTNGSKWPWMGLSFLLPSLMHVIFNYFLLSQESWLVTLIPFMIFIWWFGMKKVQKAELLSKNHFNRQDKHSSRT